MNYRKEMVMRINTLRNRIQELDAEKAELDEEMRVIRILIKALDDDFADRKANDNDS